jgi:hypothetical protein
MRWSGLDGLGLALTLLTASGIILWLSLRERPAKRVLVPSLELWAAALGERDSLRTPWRRLRSLPSLLLALLTAAALILALGDPTATPGPADSVLLVIDRSSSMAARDVSPSRLQQAKAQARAWVERMPSGSRAALVALDESALMTCPFTRDRAQLLAAIDAVEQRVAGGDLLPAAELALDLLPARTAARLVLFSDGNLAHVTEARSKLALRPTLALSHVSAGRADRNVAITSFALRRYPLDRTHLESLLALTNFGAQAEPLTLRIETSAGLLYEETLTLAPHQRVERTLRDLPSSGAELTAQLLLAGGPDALLGDDRAAARLAAQPRTRVLFVSAGNRYLEAALLLDESLLVEQLAPADYVGARGFDVAIFDAVLPASPPSCPALYLGPGRAEGALPLARGAIVERPFFDQVQREHPLLRELAWADVNVARATSLTLQPGDLALAQSRIDGVDHPLLVAGARASRRFLVLAFDLRESDLALRAAFPLFVLRAIDHLARPAGDEPVTPSLRARAATELEGAIAPRPGLFGSAPAAGRELHRAGALRASWAAELVGERGWPVLAWLALVLLAAEWFMFHRRWTT